MGDTSYPAPEGRCGIPDGDDFDGWELDDWDDDAFDEDEWDATQAGLGDPFDAGFDAPGLGGAQDLEPGPEVDRRLGGAVLAVVGGAAGERAMSWSAWEVATVFALGGRLATHHAEEVGRHVAEALHELEVTHRCAAGR